MSRFNKLTVAELWDHRVITDPEDPFCGAIKAHGFEDGRAVAVFVSHYKTRENPIPEIMGKYLLNRGRYILDDEGFVVEKVPFFVTKRELFNELKASGYDLKLRGLKLLVILMGKLLKDLGEKIKGQTKKELVHFVIDQLGPKIESDYLNFENVSGLLDHMIES